MDGYVLLNAIDCDGELRMLTDDWLRFRENVSLECNAVSWYEGHCVTQWTGNFGAEFYHMETNYDMKKTGLIFFKR